LRKAPYRSSKHLKNLPNIKGTESRQALFALAILAGLLASGGQTAAQVYWGDSPQRYQRNQGYGGYQDNFGFPFFGEHYNRPAPQVDFSKAPPPRKLETPPANTVVVIGDSMADWLAYGLDETYAEQPDIGVVRKIRPTSGLIHYDAKNESLEWPQMVKDALATEKPNVIVVMLGLNDRVVIRDKAPPKEPPRKAGDTPAAGQASQDKDKPDKEKQEKQEKPPAAAASSSDGASQDAAAGPGVSYDFHSDQWATLYAKRIDEMIAVLKGRGVPVIWVGLPALKGAKSTNEMSYLDELYRERAEKAGIIYVDIWDGFVDDRGNFAVQGPDFEGQIRRLRTWDGVHFTKAGAVKLASFVDRDIRRVINNHAVPVALPAPDSSGPKPGGPRPDIGPVLPLTATGSGEGGDLIGSGTHLPQMTSDPLAAKVLGRGDPISAPAGRSDDFSWPRPGNDTNAADLVPEPVALSPAGAKKAPPGKNDGKKAADSKSDAKGDQKGDAKNKSPATDNGNSKLRRSPSASLDGAPPRPPAAIGGGF
jgi:uncharacterized protein